MEGLFLLLVPRLRGRRSSVGIDGKTRLLWVLPTPLERFHGRTSVRRRGSRWTAAIRELGRRCLLSLPPIVLGWTRLKRPLVQLLTATVRSSMTPEKLLRRLQMLVASFLRMQHIAPGAPLTSPLRVHDPSTIESLHDSAENHLEDTICTQSRG